MGAYTLNYNKKYACASMLWALAILVVATIPGSAIEPVSKIPLLSIVAHFCEFLIFGWLLSKAFPALKNPLLISLFFSIFTEYLQLYVPGRFFSYADIATNAVGAIFGMGVVSESQNHIFLHIKIKLDAWLNGRNT